MHNTQTQNPFMRRLEDYDARIAGHSEAVRATRIALRQTNETLLREQLSDTVDELEDSLILLIKARDELLEDRLVGLAMRGPGYNFLSCGCNHCRDHMNMLFSRIVLSQITREEEETMEALANLQLDPLSDRVHANLKRRLHFEEA